MKNIYNDAFDISNNIQTALRLLECDYKHLVFESYRHMFGSSIGPQEGIGKQVMTEFQIVAFKNTLTGQVAKFCNGVWKIQDSFTYGWWE